MPSVNGISMVVEITVIYKSSVNILKKPLNFPSISRIVVNLHPCFLFLICRKSHLYEELTRLHSSVSYFYLSIPGYLQYKKEILTTMKQAIHYAQLARNTNEYLSCLYDIAQVRLIR